MAIVLRCPVYREIAWTEASEEHIAGHGVRPEEVEDAINARPVLALAGRDNTTEMYGTTSAGRTLVVILVPALDGRWYVVTARDMTSNERRAFRRKGR
jgi:uncharacterized protein